MKTTFVTLSLLLSCACANAMEDAAPAAAPIASPMLQIGPGAPVDLGEVEGITFETFANLIKARWQVGEPCLIVRIKDVGAATFDQHPYDLAMFRAWIQASNSRRNTLTGRRIERVQVWTIERPIDAPAGMQDFTNEQLRDAHVVLDQRATADLQDFYGPVDIAIGEHEVGRLIDLRMFDLSNTHIAPLAPFDF